MKIITVSDIQKIIRTMGIEKFFSNFIVMLEKEYARWNDFHKSPRHATHVKNGVIEVMPICDDELYSFKFVNGHPNNTKKNKLTVVALGLLADVKTGYPLCISEMTLLTAIRTAATSALAAKYLARKNTKKAGIIGTGAQSEFQVVALKSQFDIDTVKYFDLDGIAMEKFSRNLKNQQFKLVRCDSAKDVLENVDVITTATANKSSAIILENNWIQNGLHINGIGGDCPGKTELDKKILERAKIVVEYLPQSRIEGEIQQTSAPIYAELWELVAGLKKGREHDREITLFDSVGFALEDFAILKFIYKYSLQNNTGAEINLIPNLSNPKDLFSQI
ncbi:MAG: ornithine cyclodeaminase [Gammaproteobacteria bacterium RIFCSPHIGHO2_02_FULL_39_13]|nr:MAG: ornithine cyclodeaminase [Gammaproteobacteria bacterium RIFCSPHIGHO2_02_FULL_39_13]OGT49708.1 MAG: ornithine cyclodeaminase [Gammaproteobacteria bacterium RIFCSPHIGHO2_12_FULL_39_24]